MTKPAGYVIEVTDEDAIETTGQLDRAHDLLVVNSSGANVWDARHLAPEIRWNKCNGLPGQAERYLSTALM